MTRFSHYDTDAERLPEGMTRVAYDADTQVYRYREADGTEWETAPGTRYGHLTRVREGPRSGRSSISSTDVGNEFVLFPPGICKEKPKAWRQLHLPLVNICVLIGLFLRHHLAFVPLKSTKRRVVQLRRTRRGGQDCRGESVLGDYKHTSFERERAV